jgi:hypothetical protein
MSNGHYDEQHLNADNHRSRNYICLLHGLYTHLCIVALERVVEIKFKQHCLNLHKNHHDHNSLTRNWLISWCNILHQLSAYYDKQNHKKPD